MPPSLGKLAPAQFHLASTLQHSTNEQEGLRHSAEPLLARPGKRLASADNRFLVVLLELDLELPVWRVAEQLALLRAEVDVEDVASHSHRVLLIGCQR